MDEKTIRRLFDEEARKLGVALGPEHSVNWAVYQGVSEQEARTAISAWITEQEKLKKRK